MGLGQEVQAGVAYCSHTCLSPGGDHEGPAHTLPARTPPAVAPTGGPQRLISPTPIQAVPLHWPHEASMPGLWPSCGLLWENLLELLPGGSVSHPSLPVMGPPERPHLSVPCMPLCVVAHSTCSDPCGQSGPWGCHEVGRRGPGLSLFCTPALSTAPPEPGSLRRLSAHPASVPCRWPPGIPTVLVARTAPPHLPGCSATAADGLCGSALWGRTPAATLQPWPRPSLASAPAMLSA